MSEHGDYSACGFDIIRNSSNNDVTVDNEDLDYKMTLQNLKQHGNCYTLAVYDDNGKPEMLEYDIINDSPLESPIAVEDLAPSHRAIRYQTRNENKGVAGTWGVMPIRRKASGGRKWRPERRLGSGREYSVENYLDEEYLRFVNLGCPGLGEFDCVEEDLGSAVSEYGKMRRLYADSEGGCGRVVVEKECNNNEESETSHVAEDFIAYLDLLQMEGEEEKRDEAEESETASDLVVLDENALRIDRYSNPFVSSHLTHQKDVDSHCVCKDCDTGRSQFKKELIKILKKPYDSKQHQELRREVECRRPIPRDIDRDGKTKVCPSKRKLGKSYLSLYTDFAKLFEAQTHKHKSLNLLRGFFFWLKSISRDDAFKPWDDPSILKVLPRK